MIFHQEIRALEEITDRLICIYSSESSEIIPLNTHFDESKLISSDRQPILISYHGSNHYNSVYDEQLKLPVQTLKSTDILKIRMANEL